VIGPHIDIYSTNQHVNCHYGHNIVSDSQNKRTTESCLQLSNQFTFTQAVCLNIVFNIILTLYRLTAAWTVRWSNPGEARFSARPDRSWGPSSLLYIG